MSEDRRGVKSISVWVVVGVLLLSTVGVGWVVWNLMNGSGSGGGAEKVGGRVEIDAGQVKSTLRKESLSTVKPYVDPDPANWRGRVFSLKRADGVLDTSESSWSVKSGKSFMQAYRREDGTFGARFAQPFREFFPAEPNVWLRVRWMLAETEKLREKLAITDEQWAKLKAVSSQTDMPVTENERRGMMELLREYVAAEGEKRVALAAQLVEGMKQLEENHGEATYAKAERIADQVKGIFNEEQLRGLRERYGNW